MSNEVDHLAEICDNPADRTSDYGRGFAAGYASNRLDADSTITWWTWDEEESDDVDAV